MSQFSMNELESAFEDAKEGKFKFIAVKIHIDGLPEDEIIINPMKNFEIKLEYYKNNYDENCNHKFSKGISIVGVDYEDYVDSLIFFDSNINK